jgi:hypothetical protein
VKPLGTAVVACALLAACQPSEAEAPSFRPAHDSERFVARVVDSLSSGQLEVIEAMLVPEARDGHAANGLATIRADLQSRLGPLDAPRILKISVLPVTRDDGSVGLFGYARVSFARGDAELRLEIVCDAWDRAHEACRPPYAIEQLSVEPQRR